MLTDNFFTYLYRRYVRYLKIKAKHRRGCKQTNKQTRNPTPCCRKRASKTSRGPRRLRFDVYKSKPEAKCLYMVKSEIADPRCCMYIASGMNKLVRGLKVDIQHAKSKLDLVIFVNRANDFLLNFS